MLEDICGRNMEVERQPSDFELLEKYQVSLKAILDTMTKYIDVPSEQIIQVSILGSPTILPAREFQEHLKLQALFFTKKIEEVQERINRSEGKV